MTQQRHVAGHGTEAGYWPVRATDDWVGDVPRSHGLSFYFDLVRARIWFVVLLLAVTVGSTALFVAQAEKVYEAEADLLVTPVPGDNENYFGLGLVTESGDPTRDAETLAQLITSASVAERVRSTLGATRSASSLLKDVTAEPVAQSSIVTVVAKASDPQDARILADAFAEGAIAVRTDRMHRLLDSVIPQLRRQLTNLPATELRAREDLGGKIRALETLRLLPDPTLHLEARATAPTSPISPRPVLSIAAALIGGLLIAFGVVFGAHFVDTRIEREEDLSQFRIPVVGRIPRERRRLGNRAPLRPDELSAAGADAFHRLASSLAARVHEGERTLFVTGPGPDDGKTTTSLNLAVALGAFADGVMLLDGDSRRPAVAQALGLNPRRGLDDVVTGQVPLVDALIDVDYLHGRVHVLARDSAESAPVPLSPEAADELIRDATKRGNWLIIDGAALNYAPDTLPLAKRVANILVVVQLRKTRVRDLNDLAELLSQQDLVPDGFVVIGGKPRAVYG